MEKIHIKITLAAAVMMAIVNFALGDSLYMLSLRLIIIIILFYFIGLLVRLILTKMLEKKKEAEKTDGNKEQMETDSILGTEFDDDRIEQE